MSDEQDKDIGFIRALAKLVKETELSEIEVERDYGEGRQLRVRVGRQMTAAAAPPAPPPAPAPAPQQAQAPQQPQQQGGGASGGSAAAHDDPAKHPGAVLSPMVGTVYLQAEPGSDPFVSVGDKVSEGQTVLIIEAMKTMNQIPAPRGGTVRRILVDDGAPVEFGAPLMVIE